ncbi:MAG: universal stress protein [Halanaeroarchaeum sp.]
MAILVPVDGSECSMRALEFAIDLAEARDETIDVVHFTDYEGDASSELEERVGEVLADAGIDGGMEVVGDIRLSDFKASNRVGKDILELVADREYDHVVMGHHGTGYVESGLLGSAAETVVESTSVPVTVIP